MNFNQMVHRKGDTKSIFSNQIPLKAHYINQNTRNPPKLPRSQTRATITIKDLLLIYLYTSFKKPIRRSFHNYQDKFKFMYIVFYS